MSARITLGHLSQGRDNNFNLLRIIAAWAVLVTHSFALTTGNPESEPLRAWLGLTPGVIAVDVFFITSGFLVTGSLLARQDTFDFLWARALRIYPALWVMVGLTVFVLGAIFTELAPVSYFAAKSTYGYLVKNATLVGGVAFTLPGVFDANPAPRAINGALWTMPQETRMYLLLAVVWLAARAVPRPRVKVFGDLVLALLAGSGLVHLVGHYAFPLQFPSEGTNTRLFFMFFLGASSHILKDSIVLSRTAFIACVAAIAASALDKELFYAVYSLTIAYVVLYLAYVPRGAVRAYNKVGDYSYGTYIYAFPVQQCLAALIPDISVPLMLAMSTLLTFILAALSWHLLEQRALKLKRRRR